MAGKTPRILIVRRDNIGDLVCTTPLVDALRAALPQAWIGALVNTYNAGVLVRNPALDAVHVYEKVKHRQTSLLANYFNTVKTLRSLRKEKLDYVLVPSAGAQALKLAGTLSPKKVLATDSAWKSDPRHEVERAFTLGASFGVQGPPGAMRVFPDAAKAAELKKLLASGKPVVAVHISARQEIRRWPIERYAELIRELKNAWEVVLLWAPGAADDPRHPGDDALARAIVSLAEPVALPTPDLDTLMAALSLADRVVCPDGGAMHIAAALGKPVVALWADSPVERWRPWRVKHQVVQPESKNLADLPLRPVLDAFAML